MLAKSFAGPSRMPALCFICVKPRTKATPLIDGRRPTARKCLNYGSPGNSRTQVHRERAELTGFLAERSRCGWRGQLLEWFSSDCKYWSYDGRALNFSEVLLNFVSPPDPRRARCISITILSRTAAASTRTDCGLASETQHVFAVGLAFRGSRRAHHKNLCRRTGLFACRRSSESNSSALHRTAKLSRAAHAVCR